MKDAVLACAAPMASAATAAAAQRGGGGGGGDVVMVRRATLAACVTCALCKRLLRDATTISECLHTFCRKCIFEKFMDEEMSRCPFCNIDLGCAPLEKLRADHSLQYVRAKIFPFKRRKVEAPEVTSPITLPVRRKERSLSSLTTHAPRVSIQKCLTRRRTRASGLRGLSVQSTLRSGKDTEKVGGWRPLNCPIKVAKDEKVCKLNPQEVATSGERSSDPDVGAPADQAKAREHSTKSGGRDEKVVSKMVPPIKGKAKKVKAKLPEQKRRLRAIWFFLVAAFDQKGHPPLPQIPTKYLRIKDVDLPASFIQKYLVQKLNLSSEAEVEMLCRGQLVSPEMTLHNLAERWLDVGPKHLVRSSVGSHATEFVMAIVYRRPKVTLP